MRSDTVLHALPVAQWSPDEVLCHLEATFDYAVRQRPDLMEPYLIRLEGVEDAERLKIMREGLAETFAKRHPARHPVIGHDAQMTGSEGT